jgi:hypothetical protein
LAVAAFAEPPQTVKINFSFTTTGLNASKDFFNWTVDKNPEVKDGFDANAPATHGPGTGASKAQSTAKFDAVYRDDGTNKGKKTMPTAVRHLFLFAVSSDETRKSEDFTLIQNPDKTYTIRFINRGEAHQITTDKTGKIDLTSGAKIAEGVRKQGPGGGAFLLEPKYLKSGGDNKSAASADWAAIEKDLKPDVAESAFAYTSKDLKATYNKDKVLIVKGTLTLPKKK